MKHYAVYAAIIAGVWSFPVLAQEIHISRQGGNLIVSGHVDGSAYLGVTYSGPYESDLPVQRVRGDFKNSFVFSPIHQRVTASLWEKKVTCKEPQCRWCMANGYHMEGRMASADESLR